ncbi:hypothetical protein BKA69DRAFT_33365 [Paraphysoderma sedebokerense]|nr:hypothetical protein BKA69DRAFT_33365 [Paraphysoderma sedebokerense]
MGLFYREMSEHFGIPNSDSTELTRVIFLYSRSNVMVKFKGSDADGVELMKRFHSCGKYFFDCIYLHEKPNEDSDPQDVYDSLTAVESQEGLSYFFEVTRSWRRFYLAMTSLLAHPLQRPKQSSADYFLN